MIKVLSPATVRAACKAVKVLPRGEKGLIHDPSLWQQCCSCDTMSCVTG